MKSIRPVLLSFSAVALLLKSNSAAQSTAEAAFPQCALAYDPSYVAFSNDNQSATRPQKFLERWRILTDLNGDGNDDLILSEDPAYFGNGGGPWDVYICSNGNWRCIGDVGMHPGAFALDKVGDVVELWYYWHSSAREGIIGYHAFKPDGTIEREKDENKILVHGDDDDDSLFECLYKAVFGYAHRHPYRFEQSETSADGIVTWKEVRDWKKPSRMDELFESRTKMAEAEQRIRADERKLRRLEERLSAYESGVLVISGITLGEKWNGDDTVRVCDEEFSGFTNMVVSVDSSGFVDRIRLTRGGEDGGGAGAIEGDYDPTDEELKIIHQIENRFHIRLQRRNGSYVWGGHSTVMRIELRFSGKREEDSFIEFCYTRRSADDLR